MHNPPAPVWHLTFRNLALAIRSLVVLEVLCLSLTGCGRSSVVVRDSGRDLETTGTGGGFSPAADDASNSADASSSGGAVAEGGSSGATGGTGGGSGLSSGFSLDAGSEGKSLRSLSAGYGFTCAVRPDGTVMCWGRNTDAQLGNGTAGSGTHPKPGTVVGLTEATMVASGDMHACALRKGGSISCWGRGTFLGSDVGAGSYPPLAVAEITDATAVAAGHSHTCALLADGTAKCWGSNFDGQLGDGSTSPTGAKTTPNPVVGLSGASAIGVGRRHTCALIKDGRVMCWGLNSMGQLGDGSTVGKNATPVVVAGLTDAVAISTGGDHTCALRKSGGVGCWGHFSYDRLGKRNSGIERKPVAVTDLADATSVAAGGTHTCAIRQDGSVMCWGANDLSQLGSPAAPTSVVTGPPVAVPGVSGAVLISAGEEHTCAELGGGEILCWGNNELGGTGDPSTTSKPVPTSVPVLGSVVALGAGSVNTCVVLASGRVSCWGADDAGQLGDGGKDLFYTTSPLEVSGITDASQVAVGLNHACALLSDGGARCWGQNDVGQLGNGISGGLLTATAVSGLTSATQLALGDEHSCALLAGGTIRCWGSGYVGQIGDGGSGERHTPSAVTGITGARAVVAGGVHSCAVLGDGTMKCWGKNDFGQIGDGTSGDNASKETPVAVASLSNATGAAASLFHSCALLVDGTAKCWGNNSAGQLGDGTTTQRTVPVAVAGLADAVALSAGASHTCALRKDGTGLCWGDNAHSQLGSNKTNGATPVAVDGLSAAAAITAGRDHTCALLSDGKVKCWGNNDHGQIGDGTATHTPTPTRVEL